MSNSDDCKNYRETIAAFMLGELKTQSTKKLRQHIAACQSCNSFYQDLANEEKMIRSAFKSIADRTKTVEDKLVDKLSKHSYRSVAMVEKGKIAVSNRTTSIKPINFVSIWIKIMRTRVTKFAAVAAMIIGIIWALNSLLGGPDMTAVAWADVISHFDHVDYVHFYEISQRDNNPKVRLEGWYSKGKLMIKKHTENRYLLDDGHREIVFDGQGIEVNRGTSKLANIKRETFFDKITYGLLDYSNEELSENVPNKVGDDFLIYSFEPPKGKESWIKNILITVGKNSLLPVQMKIYRSDQQKGYDLIIFDYEAPEKPEQFFDPRNLTSHPHGKGKLVLGGDEKVISLSESPNIRALAIRIYRKYSEYAGELNVFDASVITTEGFRRSACRQWPFEPEEGVRFSLGTADWPDGKFRHIELRFKFDSTGERDEYLVEANCWADLAEN